MLLLMCVCVTAYSGPICDEIISISRGGRKKRNNLGTRVYPMDTAPELKPTVRQTRCSGLVLLMLLPVPHPLACEDALISPSVDGIVQQKHVP